VSSNTKAGGKDTKETTASVKLNQMTGGMAPAQGNSVLLEGAGGDGAGGKGGEGAEDDEEKRRAKAALGAKKASKSSGPDPEACQTAGEPVDVVSGAVVDDAIDFRLPGVIPVFWARDYSSARNAERGSLGWGGWCHSYEQWIDETAGDDDESLLRLRDGNGCDRYFEAIDPDATAFHRGAKLTLTARANGGFEVYEHQTRRTRIFRSTASNGDRAWLSEIRDAYGNCIKLSYDQDQLTEIVDTAGRVVRLSSDQHGRLTRAEIWASPPIPPLLPGAAPPAAVPPKLERWVDYGYHETGELAEVTDALGQVESFAYDGRHRVVRTTRRNGVSFYYRYDEDTGFCIKTWGDGGLHCADLEHDPQEKTTLTSGTNEARRYVYNDLGLVVEEHTHDGTLARLREFDDDRYLLSEANAAGETTTFEYDTRGRCVKTTDPAGNETQWVYAAGEDPIARVEPNGLETTYRLDDKSEVTGVTYPTGASVEILYDVLGRFTGADGPEGPLVRFVYDSHHNLAHEIDARGAKTLYAYDSMGRPRMRIDALGKRSTVSYDQLGQALRIDRPDGTFTEAEYEPLGNVSCFVDALGRTTRMKYGGTGKLLSLLQPDGQSWHFKYDDDERLETIVNARTEEYRFEHDAAGRVEREHTFDGRLIQYRYNQAERLARVDYADETWREFAYDPLGNVVEDRSPHGDIYFERDTLGRLQTAKVVEYNGETVNEFARDEFGRVVAETQQGRTLRYAYDLQGRRVQRIIPNGETTDYAYDAKGALAAVTHNGHQMSFERDILGREIAKRVSTSGVLTQTQHDAMGRPVEQRVEVPTRSGQATQEALVARRWRYDAAGQVTHIDDKR